MAVSQCHKALMMADTGFFSKTLRIAETYSGLVKHRVYADMSDFCRDNSSHHEGMRQQPARCWVESGADPPGLPCPPGAQTGTSFTVKIRCCLSACLKLRTMRIPSRRACPPSGLSHLWLHMRCTFQARTDCKVANNILIRCAHTHKWWRTQMPARTISFQWMNYPN